MKPKPLSALNHLTVPCAIPNNSHQGNSRGHSHGYRLEPAGGAEPDGQHGPAAMTIADHTHDYGPWNSLYPQ
jgi:hypothetical protein